MKNLTPLFVLCCIGFVIGIMATMTGGNYQHNHYPSVDRNIKSDLNWTTSESPCVKYKLPFKEKECVELPTYTYSKPIYTPLPTTNIILPPVNSILGQDNYINTWNNLITVSNPSLSPTRYVTISRSTDVATGIVTIRYR